MDRGDELLSITLLPYRKSQGVKVRMLSRQNKRNLGKDRLPLTSLFGLCFVLFHQIKSNFLLIYIKLCL